MVSITCPCAECKYNGKGHKCTAKAIKLSYRNMVTVNEGRVDMWICDKSFEGFLQRKGNTK